MNLNNKFMKEYEPSHEEFLNAYNMNRAMLEQDFIEKAESKITEFLKERKLEGSLRFRTDDGDRTQGVWGQKDFIRGKLNDKEFEMMFSYNCTSPSFVKVDGHKVSEERAQEFFNILKPLYYNDYLITRHVDSEEKKRFEEYVKWQKEQSDKKVDDLAVGLLNKLKPNHADDKK